MTLVIVVGLFVFWDAIFDRVILKSDMLDNPIYSHNRSLRRFGSFFLNPNYLGAFIVLVFPAAFVWTLNERQTWPRLYAWTALLALVFCLVETQSRAPLLAFSITILILGLGPSGGMSRKRRLAFLALFVLIFAVFMPGFYERATKRFDSMDVETSVAEGRSRETTWIYTGRMIADHPLFGIGFGESQFMKSMSAYGFQGEYGVESLDAPHNSYLQAAVYAGIPALVALLLANAVLLGKAVVSLRGTEGESTHSVFGLAVGITGFLACIYTDLQLFTLNVAPIYWVFFGLLLSLLARAPKVQPA
jgi:O-antigen ligase